jgi:hypothetical protein
MINLNYNYEGKLHGGNKVKTEYLNGGRAIRDYFYIPEDRMAVVTDTYPEANGADDVSYDNWAVVEISDKIATLQ